MEFKDIIALIIGAALLLTVGVYLIANQRQKVYEWLIYAVTEAEKQFGGGTGQLKLRQVYDWFTGKFKFISAVLPFKVFSDWVDIALQSMAKLIENKAVSDYIDGGKDEK